MNRKVFALAGSLAIIALACSKASEDAIVQPVTGGCDTVNMHYIANVVPILQARCYECHGTESSQGSGGIVLQNFDVLKEKVNNGQLIGAITHAPNFPAMPLNQPKLSDCDINTIRSWINNGAQNN